MGEVGEGGKGVGKHGGLLMHSTSPLHPGVDVRESDVWSDESMDDGSRFHFACARV